MGATRPAHIHGQEPPRGSLGRALVLIDLLASDLPHARLSELATASGLSLSTTSRLLASLVAGGLVQRDESRTYGLGPRMVELGRRAAETEPARSLDAHPVRPDSAAVLRRSLTDDRDELVAWLTAQAEDPRPEEFAAAGYREASWLDCAVRIADQPGSFVGAEVSIEPSEPAEAAGDQPTTPAAGFTGLARTRARTLETIAELNPEQLARIGIHRRYGPMSVLQCLEEIGRGDQDQLRRLKGQQAELERAGSSSAHQAIAHQRRVLLHHVNLGGVATTVAMLTFLEEAEAELLHKLGLSELERRFIRIYFEIQHRRACFYQDDLTVHLSVRRVGARSVHYDFTIFNAGAVAAFGRWGLGFRDSSGRPVRVPEAVRNMLERGATGPDSSKLGRDARR